MIDLPIHHTANVSFPNKMPKDLFDTLFGKKNYI